MLLIIVILPWFFIVRGICELRNFENKVFKCYVYVCYVMFHLNVSNVLKCVCTVNESHNADESRRELCRLSFITFFF